jgi:hypothetical protein
MIIEKIIYDSEEKLQQETFRYKYKHLIEAFDQTSKQVRVQLLSLIDDQFSKKTIMSVMPHVTEFQLRTARLHAKNNGVGTLFVKQEIFREKINPLRLDHFLEYIVGEDFLHDVSYGTRILKTTVGNIVVPDVMRMTSNTNLINLYHENCRDQSMTPLSKTTCFKILNKCSASFRKSMKGLDSMKVDGLNSFDKLEEIVKTLDSLGLNKEKSLNLSRLIVSCCNYLKFKFRKNLKISSFCADHCINFALSEIIDVNKKETNKIHKLGIECDHNHTLECNDCLSIDTLFREIDFEIINLTKDGSEIKQLSHYLSQCKEHIKEWKHHIIRGFNQDLIKYKQLDEIKDKDEEPHIVPENTDNFNSLKIKNKGKEMNIYYITHMSIIIKTF